MFIYVFSTEAKDALLERGMQLLTSCSSSPKYVFLANNDLIFDMPNIEYALSDVLTF